MGGAGVLGVALGASFFDPTVAGAALTRGALTRGAGRQRIRGPLFNMGVASGDPLPDSVVLWTRLALDRRPRTGTAACRTRR